MISMALLDRDGCTVFTTRWCSGGVTMFWSDVGRIQKVDWTAGSGFHLFSV